MSAEWYIEGQAIDFTVEVRDRAGVLADPDVLTFRLKLPDDVELTLTAADVEHLDAGLYRHTEVMPSPAAGDGICRWRWESVEPSSADEGAFHVSASAFA